MNTLAETQPQNQFQNSRLYLLTTTINSILKDLYKEHKNLPYESLWTPAPLDTRNP